MLKKVIFMSILVLDVYMQDQAGQQPEVDQTQGNISDFISSTTPPPNLHANVTPSPMSQQVPSANEASPGHTAHVNEFGGKESHDAEHIKSHLEGKIDPTIEMTPQQLRFHYFKLQDADNSGCLDGVELLKAITHFHQDNLDSRHAQAKQSPPMPSEVELTHAIDQILNDHDKDGDGCISYAEFLNAETNRQ